MEFVQPLLTTLFKLRTKTKIELVVKDYFRHFLRNNTSIFLIQADVFGLDNSITSATFLEFLGHALDLN